ncbi:NifB/NifX family molybdenum-iron cluster-binding protein [Methanothermobacter tenebrarum]|uniref:Dinitrogenase iron-molybdenum cofactor biosynthesis domain-containing protein n=1 Tax=Methanothermobacter tenebrarum TaxID=680118 RepID=A0A328PDV4_9EURY|nr:NifB/NifX family molybdenum-iron cluster-binding protein [Methanothermobacter tenebrarum]MBC7118299.1 NifB/NifX family molybdenum-iron cluster-binding protein [Methanobacteriaceae archaeon]NPV65185.1 NifB/NifX family molybdenum-iron cluster-binding protein [Methanobacteriaceae archaeon]RAO79553.1 hypothetical protein DPC56_01885 [Methanothermobacter tenebrarum]
MKIAVASSGDDIKSEASRFFGRAQFFIIAEIKNGKIEFFKSVANSATSESSGAGIKAAQLIANEGVDAIISTAIGPNAFELLNNLNIKIYKSTQGSVEENLKLFNQGKLQEVTSPATTRGRRGGRIL